MLNTYLNEMRSISGGGAAFQSLKLINHRLSVSKINQILSVFVSVFWLLLIFKSIWPISCSMEPDFFKIGVLAVTVSAVSCLFYFGKSDNKVTKTQLTPRSLSVEP